MKNKKKVVYLQSSSGWTTLHVTLTVTISHSPVGPDNLPLYSTVHPSRHNNYQSRQFSSQNNTFLCSFPAIFSMIITNVFMTTFWKPTVSYRKPPNKSITLGEEWWLPPWAWWCCLTASCNPGKNIVRFWITSLSQIILRRRRRSERCCWVLKFSQAKEAGNRDTGLEEHDGAVVIQ